MCGIIGYISTENFKARDVHEILGKGLELCRSRGKDATGYALFRGDELYYCKSPIQADRFVKMPAFRNTSGADIITCHCRNATHGKAVDNNNNHPIVSESGIAVAHNGIIGNYDELKRKHADLFKYDVDSESILRLIELNLGKNGNMASAIVKACKGLEGSATFSVISQSELDTLYLVKHQNPLHLFYSEKLGVVFYSSQKDFVRPFLADKKKFGVFVGGYYEFTPDEDTLTIIKRVKVDGKVTLDIKSQKVEFKTFMTYWRNNESYGGYEYNSNYYRNSCGYGGSNPKLSQSKQEVLFDTESKTHYITDGSKKAQKWIKNKRLADNNLTMLWDKDKGIHYLISTLDVLSEGNKRKANEFHMAFKGRDKAIILFNKDYNERYCLGLARTDDELIKSAIEFIQSMLTKSAEIKGDENGETEPAAESRPEPAAESRPEPAAESKPEPAAEPAVGNAAVSQCSDCEWKHSSKCLECEFWDNRA